MTIFTNLEGTFKIIVLMDAIKIRLLWANIYINMCMKLLELQGFHIKVSQKIEEFKGLAHFICQFILNTLYREVSRWSCDIKQL